MFRGSRFSRPSAISVVVLTLASPAFARQAPAAVPSANETAAPQFVAASASSPSLATTEPKTTHYKRNGALIGLGAGMGTVFIAEAGQCAQYPANCRQMAVGAAVWGAIGAGIGAWIGSGLTPETTSDVVFADRVNGKRLLVTMADGRVFDGRFESTPAGLLTESGAMLSSNKIARIEKVTHRVRNGLLGGLVPGIAIGALAYAGSCEDQCSTAALFVTPAISAGIGAAIGAAMNATRGRSDVLFNANSAKKTTTVSVAPFSRRRVRAWRCR
ncbi:MAG TPA: hypothetical protein VFV78_06800 [Vicinamibacterales bacterium]|nr:hypothetical protein [Vicinamibacterales bacterium]